MFGSARMWAINLQWSDADCETLLTHEVNKQRQTMDIRWQFVCIIS